MAAELRELLRSLRLPVIAAPMLRVSELALAAAACRAGIVGAFPTVNARTSTRLDEWLDALDAVQREDGAAPYCPNLIIKAPTLYEHLAVITQHDTRLVITSVGSPAPCRTWSNNSSASTRGVSTPAALRRPAARSMH